MKKSQYTLFIDTLDDSRELVFNTRTRAFGIMDEQTRRLYESIEEIQPERLADADKNHFDQLVSMGFVVEDNIDEYAGIILKENMQRYGRRHLSLTIAPTLSCNMACPYCYEQAQEIFMSEAVQNAVVEFVKKHILMKKIESFSVSWYGGEPLLQKNTIYHLSDQLIALCDEHNIPYRATMVSNGYLLDHETAEILANRCRVKRIQITIDGLEDVHNRRRRLRSGGKSFQTIINNIDAAKEFLHISIRINVDKENRNEIDKMIDFFIHEKGWGKNPSVYLAPVRLDGEEAERTCVTTEDYLSLNTQVLEKLCQASDSRFIDYIYPRKMTVACAAVCLNNYLIGPEGELYTCWNNIGIKSRVIGNVRDLQIKNNEEYLKWLLLDTPGKCRACAIYPLCHAGCPLDRIYNNNEPKCAARILTFKNNLLLTYQKYMESKSRQAIASD